MEKQEGPEKDTKISITVIVCVLILNILVSSGTVFLYDRYFAPKIVAVDLQGYIAKQKDLFLDGKIDEEQFRLNIDRLEKAIDEVPKNKIILTGDVVIRNAEVLNVLNP